MAPIMIDVPMDAQALKDLLPAPTFEPTTVNIPIDAEAIQAACTGMTTTIIKEVRVEGISGWWLVLTIVLAIIAIGAISMNMQKAPRRLMEEFRDLPPHKLHEKLEERYLHFLKEASSPELKDYVAKKYKGAIYEDDLVRKERTIKIVQDLSEEAQYQSFPQSYYSQPLPDYPQTQVETSTAQDQETDELSEGAGLIKNPDSSSDSDAWSDVVPEEKKKEEGEASSQPLEVYQDWGNKSAWGNLNFF